MWKSPGLPLHAVRLCQMIAKHRTGPGQPKITKYAQMEVPAIRQRLLTNFATPEQIRRAIMHSTNSSFERYYQVTAEEIRMCIRPLEVIGL